MSEAARRVLRDPNASRITENSGSVLRHSANGSSVRNDRAEKTTDVPPRKPTEQQERLLPSSQLHINDSSPRPENVN